MRFSRRFVYKVLVSLLFGLLGFFLNFYTIIFQFGDYTVAVLFGLLFPLLITLSWGWKYGLLSALAGGCQTMWWLWSSSNGYAVFFIVPPFTLWIVWHGIGAYLRRKRREEGKDSIPWLSFYFWEIPFRLLNSLNLLTLTRWAISKNPAPWSWAANSFKTAPMGFSFFIVLKQASVAFVLLFFVDVLLNINFVRTFFRLEPLIDQKRTGYVVSFSLLLGCLYWVLDSLFGAFVINKNISFVDLFARNIPDANLFARLLFLLFTLGIGMAVSRILRRQKSAEIELRKAREEAVERKVFLQTLFNTLPDLVLLKDIDGKYLSCNVRAEEYFGLKESEIRGKDDFDLLPKEMAEAFRREERATIEKDEASTFKTNVVFALDGHRELLEVLKTPMYDNGKNLLGILCIGRDISERDNLQRQLIQAQKLESVGRLAGGVAHDFNNMLTVIIGVSDLVLAKIPPDSPLIGNMNEIQNAAIRSAKLTRQLLAFARKQAISPQKIDINDSLEGTLTMLGRLMGENIKLVWLPGKDLWKVKVDSTQIDQILANLCVNAADSIKHNGEVTIETKNVTMDAEIRKNCSDFIPGDFVQITISDTGTGISPEQMEHIFEPFYTTKEIGKGTGLGLATVYGIMKQHKGFIHVVSDLGNGTKFKLFFPRYIGGKEEEKEIVTKEISLNGDETILVVEDELGILEVIETQLKELGYRILAFSDPNKALEECKKESSIDLLITDVIMPEMNGKEVSQAIIKIHPRIKTLFVSGYTSDIITNEGVLEDGVFFLSKPFSLKVLAGKIREVLTGEG